MRKKVSGVILGILILFQTSIVLARLHVPLMVKERSGSHRINAPVTTGVPLLQTNNITSTSQLAVVNDPRYDPRYYKKISF